MDLATIIAALQGQPKAPSFEDRYPSYAGSAMTVMPGPNTDVPSRAVGELSGIDAATRHMAPQGLPWQSWRPSTNVEDNRQQSAMNILKDSMTDPMNALLKHLGSR